MRKGCRPKIPAAVPAYARDMVEKRCWPKDPHERWSMKEICECLERETGLRPPPEAPQPHRQRVSVTASKPTLSLESEEKDKEQPQQPPQPQRSARKHGTAKLLRTTRAQAPASPENKSAMDSELRRMYMRAPSTTPTPNERSNLVRRQSK